MSVFGVNDRLRFVIRPRDLLFISTSVSLFEQLSSCVRGTR